MSDDPFNFDDDLPDWLQDSDSDAEGSGKTEREQFGVTGDLPWRQEPSGAAQPPRQSSDMDDLDWDILGDETASSELPGGFDDELPDWLRDPSPEPDHPAEADYRSAEPSSGAQDEQLPGWLSGSGETPPPRDRQVSESDEAGPLPDWLSQPEMFQDDAASSFDMSVADSSLGDEIAEEDWLGAAEEVPLQPDASLAPDDDFPDWFDDSAADRGQEDSVAGWFEEDFGEELPAEQELDVSGGWFADDTSEDDQASVEATSQELEDLLLDDMLLEDLPGDIDFDELPDVPSESAGTAKGIRRIARGEEPKAPAPEEASPRASSERPRLRRLGDSGELKQPDEMTFDEWERMHEQSEYEAEHADELAMEAEVPDWFRDNVQIGDAASEVASILMPDAEMEPPQAEEALSSGTGPISEDYVPEWFLGLEEQNLEDAPDWVREATAAPADTGDLSILTDTSAFAPPEPETPAEAEVETPQEEVPDWFQGLDVGGESQQADWLSSLGIAPSEEQSPGTEMPEADDWMAEIAPQEVPHADIEPTYPLQGDVPIPEFDDLVPLEQDMEDTDEPDWLQGVGLTPSQEAAPAPSIFDEEADSGMDWLEDIGGVDFSAGFEAPPETPATEQKAPASAPARPPAGGSRRDLDQVLASSGSLDDLLDGLRAPSGADEPGGSMFDDRQVSLMQGPDEVSSLFDGVDDTLFEDFAPSDQAQVAEAPSPTTPAAGQKSAPPAYGAEGPEWVEQFRPEEQVKLRAGGLEIDFAQQGLGHLSEEFRKLRDETLSFVTQAPHPTGDQVDSGTLAGISGTLAVSPLVDSADRPAMATQINVASHQAERLELLNAALDIAYDESATSEDEAEQEAVRPARRTRRRFANLDRVVITLVLLAGIILPFASDAFHVAEDPSAEMLAGEQQSVPMAVAMLQPGDRVLLAFDYGPTAAGELNDLAEAVLRDILRQRAIPVAISTNPLGALNAQHVLDQLATDEALLNALERTENLEAGTDYFALRYLSGGPVAVRSLARSEPLASVVFSTDSRGETTDLDIGRVDADDFSMVLVLGESIDDVRNWAEQFQVDDLPKYALVTSAIEPLARVYVEPEGDMAYAGYLAGYRDTYRYNQLRNQDIRDAYQPPDDLDVPDPALSRWHSTALAALLAGLIVILGMVFNTIRGLWRRP
ncbi:MAG: hypothetical protein GYB66_09630 [Chloroflexi bacterium]|nr:hypothetical protein [Chloroflexota bacterium]